MAKRKIVVGEYYYLIDGHGKKEGSSVCKVLTGPQLGSDGLVCSVAVMYAQRGIKVPVETVSVPDLYLYSEVENIEELRKKAIEVACNNAKKNFGDF